MPRHTPRNVLVTGGAGFIGCNLARWYLENRPEVRVVVYDALTYAGSLHNLEGLEARYPGRYLFVRGDINDTALAKKVMLDENVDTVAHLAAESHVDRSITGPAEFLRTNIMGTYSLL